MACFRMKGHISGISSSAFLRFCCTQNEVIFYLLVNTGKPKFIALLVFVCTTASFTCLQVRLWMLSEQQLFDGWGAQPLKFVSNAEGSICQFLNPFVFFSGVQKVVYCYFCLVRFHFFSFSLALFPKGWLAVFFLSSRTILQVACGTPSTNVAVVGSYRLNYCWCYCFALQTKKMTLKNLVPNARLKFCCLSCLCAVAFVRIRKRHG